MSARNPSLPPPKGALVHPPPYRARRAFAWTRRVMACGLLALLPLAAGCRSGDADTVPNPSAVADGDENWFCGEGDDNGEWTCVRDQELRAPAATPSPAPASPQRPRPRPGPTAERSAAPPAAVRQTPATPRPAGESAYRPGEPVPLTEVPPHYYVVQLVAVGSKESLEEYATRKALRGMSAARVERGGRLFYVLLLGVFATRDAADEAAGNLPAALSEFNPWVRRVDSLQEAIRRGDALAGTSEI